MSKMFSFITKEAKGMIKQKYDRKKAGYVHRLIMVKHLGRQLKQEEVVHHIDGDLSNNRIENLRLFKDDAEHHRHHWKQGSYKKLLKPKVSESKRQKIIDMTKAGFSYSEIVREIGISYNIVKKYALQAGVKSRYSRVDGEKKKRIRELLDEGRTYRLISKEVGIGIGTISQLRKRGEL